MKVIPFSVPKPAGQSLIIEEYHLPWFYNRLHRHREIQITLILKGKGTLLAGSYMQHFKEGDIYILGPDLPHLFQSDPLHFENKIKNRIHALSIFLDPSGPLESLINLPEMKDVKRFLNKTKTGLQVPSNKQDKISEDILQLKKSTNGALLANVIKLLTDFTYIKTFKVLSEDGNSLPTPEEEGLRMHEICQYTMTHLTENISIRKIASVAHLSVPAFCKYFKTRTQKTYISFLNEMRINEACSRLMNENQNESISSIAYGCGFNNITSFNRVFKKIKRATPLQFRNNLKMLAGSS